MIEEVAHHYDCVLSQASAEQTLHLCLIDEECLWLVAQVDRDDRSFHQRIPGECKYIINE